ncbi:MAG: hypothetical protein HY293_15100, partial [Planctomycetes bacterium]|nr:hypothetical protein [Planctomycetota bacterium]
KGLQGDYYTDMNLTNFAMSRVDPGVNYNWGTGSPDSSIPADGFSVRWTGQIVPLYSETYTFYVNSDDGSRLWVNGVLLFDHWVDQGPTEWSGSIALTAGVAADIVFEYYENGGGAVAQLSWSSSSQAKGAIPGSAMGTLVLTGAPAGGVVPLVAAGGKGGGGCGLTGLEGWILMGAAAFFKRRRR